MSGKNLNKFRDAVSCSVFISALKKVSEFIFSKIGTSKTAQLFTSYDSLNEKASKSFMCSLLSFTNLRKRKMIDVKRAASHTVENSFFNVILKKVIDKVLGAKIRMYGAVMFIMGIFSAGIGVIEKFVETVDTNNSSLLWQGLAFILFSIPLMLSKDELCISLSDGHIGSALIKFIGYKREDVIRPTVNENMTVVIIVGVLLGCLTPLIQPIYFVILFFALAYLCIVFNKPEFSIIFTIFTLPFLPTMVICGEIILTLIAYLLKVIRGKRSLKFDILDVFVLIFVLFMFSGGLFSVNPASSLPPACVFICFLSSYFLVVNLIKTKELLLKLLGSSLFSLAICSLYGIYQNFFAAPDTTWTDEDMFSDIETRVVSTFENPNVFGEYLIMLIPVVIAFLIIYKRTAFRTCNFAVLAVSLAALVYTWSRGAWIGCIGALIIFFVIANRYSLGTYFFGILAVPLAVPMLPSSILDRFTSIGNMADSSTSYRVFIWEASANMIKDYLISGIGIGTGAFQTVYSEYALAGIETAPHSHNLYLQIMIELGIFGFCVFLFTIFLFYSKVLSFLSKSDNREAKLIVGAIACGLLAILAQGLTDYVWYNYRVYAFFWMMLGTCVAAINVYKINKQTDELM